MKYCTKCGSTVPDGSNFCQNCGSTVHTSSSEVKVCSSSINNEKQAGKLVQIVKIFVYVWSYLLTHTLVRASFIGVYVIRGYSSVVSQFDLEMLDMNAQKFAVESQSLWSLIANIIFTAAVITLAHMRRNNVRNSFRIRRIDPRLFPAFLLFGASANVILSFIMSMIPWSETVMSGHNATYSFISASSVLLAALSTAFVTGFTEELLFRSVIITRLRPVFGTTIAAVISCVVFSACHAEPIAMTYSFIFAAFLSIFFIKYDSIWPSVISHIFFNLTGILLGYLPGDMLVSLAILAGSAAALILSLFIIFRKDSRNIYNN